MLASAALANAREVRSPLSLSSLSSSVTAQPKAAPKASEPSISPSGFNIICHTDSSLPPTITCATALHILKAISAAASSIATTGSRILVTGPCALYCRTTISVAAGAVAAAIAPSIMARGASKPAASSAPVTTSTAINASSSIIIMGAAPTFLRNVSLNSLPMEKAIKPRATSEIISKPLITSFGIIPVTPSSSPPTRYPVTLGRRTSLAR